MGNKVGQRQREVAQLELRNELFNVAAGLRNLLRHKLRNRAPKWGDNVGGQFCNPAGMVGKPRVGAGWLRREGHLHHR